MATQQTGTNQPTGASSNRRLGYQIPFNSGQQSPVHASVAAPATKHQTNPLLHLQINSSTHYHHSICQKSFNFYWWPLFWISQYSVSQDTWGGYSVSNVASSCYYNVEGLFFLTEQINYWTLVYNMAYTRSHRDLCQTLLVKHKV
jgi:hypothetical protein